VIGAYANGMIHENLDRAIADLEARMKNIHDSL
jgi:hypothetical protein